MVTPSLQHAMRTKQGKSLKRERKPRKTGKKNKKDSKSKKHSKTSAAKHTSKAKDRLNIMKAAKENSPSKRKAKTKSTDVVGDGDVGENTSKSAKKVRKVTAPEVTEAPTKAVSKPKSKAKAMKRSAAAGNSAGSSSSGSAGSGVGVKGHQQERVGKGKGWVYRVLPHQTFGCRSCRFIFNGCHHCQKEKFRGFSAASMREQQEAARETVEEEAEGSHAEVTGENIKAKNGKNGKKVKKVKTAKVSK